MAENKTDDSSTSDQGGLTVITIPDDKVQAVIGFLAGLEGEEDEVSGHMISGALAGFGGALSARVTKHRTDTGCVQIKTGVGVDFNCSDSDTLTD